MICLGFKGEVIKEYFLTYNEALSNDFVLRNGGRDIELLRHDIQDWEITFVDTGLHTSIGERLSAVRAHVEGEDPSSRTTETSSPTHACRTLIENHTASGAVASFLCVKPGYTFHLVQTDDRDFVHSVVDTTHSDLWINGGYFVFQPEIFEYIEPGEDLVEEPFARLSEAGLLFANKYEGFWAPMDTLKDQQRLEQMVDSGNGPWKVWELDGAVAEEAPSSLESPAERA